jgi:hypothetical protein
VIYYFMQYAKQFRHSHDYRRGNRPHDSEMVGTDDSPLTTADVEAAFARSTPVREER